MKVKELIEKLETLPQDARVWSYDFYGDARYDINVDDRNNLGNEIGVRGGYRGS